jgi:hypothetical protein
LRVTIHRKISDDAAWERFDVAVIFLSSGKATTRRAMFMFTTTPASFSGE